MKIVAIILAGGVGRRFGSRIPKQFMSLNGKPVVQFVVDAIKESGVIDAIGYVGLSKYWDNVSVTARGIEGGKTRTESVQNGIKIAKSFGATHVIFLDAVRPLITPTHIRRMVKELKNGAKAVITTQKIVDSL